MNKYFLLFFLSPLFAAAHEQSVPVFYCEYFGDLEIVFNQQVLPRRNITLIGKGSTSLEAKNAIANGCTQASYVHNGHGGVEMGRLRFPGSDASHDWRTVEAENAQFCRSLSRSNAVACERGQE